LIEIINQADDIQSSQTVIPQRSIPALPGLGLELRLNINGQHEIIKRSRRPIHQVSGLRFLQHNLGEHNFNPYNKINSNSIPEKTYADKPIVPR
jgi:hypothetical protein